MNGILILEGPILFAANSYFQNILKLYLSMIVCKEHIEFTNNLARYIINGNGGSFFLVTEYSTVIISNNTVYMVAKYVRTFG